MIENCKKKIFKVRKKISRRFARSAFDLPRSALEKVPNETFWVISTHCATTRTHWAGFFLVFNHWFSDKKMHFKVPRKPFTTIFQPYSQSFRRAQNILWNCLFKSEFGRFSRRKCRKTNLCKKLGFQPHHLKSTQNVYLNFGIFHQFLSY